MYRLVASFSLSPYRQNPLFVLPGERAKMPLSPSGDLRIPKCESVTLWNMLILAFSVVTEAGSENWNSQDFENS